MFQCNIFLIAQHKSKISLPCFDSSHIIWSNTEWICIAYRFLFRINSSIQTYGIRDDTLHFVLIYWIHWNLNYLVRYGLVKILHWYYYMYLLKPRFRCAEVDLVLHYCCVTYWPFWMIFRMHTLNILMILVKTIESGVQLFIIAIFMRFAAQRWLIQNYITLSICDLMSLFEGTLSHSQVSLSWYLLEPIVASICKGSSLFLIIRFSKIRSETSELQTGENLLILIDEPGAQSIQQSY